ncbi:voltage-gated potassium channel [Chitinivorax tropicus]|uniref:Voltage-gated potassium channel n=1 Tax=Chitinivorax tropicus TaxID=714531 RepID=A0A840MUX9_9PROT|nr:voltage-gated potassium channel [Chitinivorax tropicus]
MYNKIRVLLGSAGVPPGDTAEAYEWERRLHWLMLFVAMLALPTYYLEEIAIGDQLHQVGRWLDALILAAFSFELVWMMRVVKQRRRYLLHNWLDVLIIAASAASFFGIGTEWVALTRVLRLTAVAMMIIRVMSSVRHLFSPDGLPYVLLFGILTMLCGGAAFYWLEPTIHSFGEGVWLAFTTAATVGYGDLVPTEPASRVFAVILVLVGYSMLGMVTASIASIFIGEDEKTLRREMHRDIQKLQGEMQSMREELRAMRELLMHNQRPSCDE